MAPASLPAITEADIRGRVGEASFARGTEYARRGALFGARRQGRTLKAQCEGTSAPSYRLSVTFGDKGIASADCSCPVGGGGQCKHTAALLLTWLARPETFREVEETDSALARHSKEELIALVKHMLRRHPDLELLLETPLPTVPTLGATADHQPAAGHQRRKPVDPEVYRRQARAAFRGLDYEDAYGAESGVAGELAAITEIGDAFAEQGDYPSATAVYQAVADATIENYELFSDESGELAGVVQQSVEGLGTCLQQTPPGERVRETVIKALFDVYRFDVDFGGVGLSDAVPELLAQHTTPDEKRTLAHWVRQALPGKAPIAPGDVAQAAAFTSAWRRQAYGALLLELEADTLDDEAFLRICRETGRFDDLVARLLHLGRVDEAVDATDRVDDYTLLQVAEIFERDGHGDRAEQLVRQRAQHSPDTRLTSWLKERYKQRGDLDAALRLARPQFERQPTLAGYQELREVARALARWETLRPQVLRQLEAAAQAQPLLIEIALDEDDVDRAIALVRAGQRAEGAPRLYGAGGYGGYGGYANAYLPSSNRFLQVAERAEEARPREAIEIYRHAVDHLIAARGRPAYQQAAALLRRARALYERLGESDTWTPYVATLRDRHRSLRALKDELAKAGL